MITYKRLVIDGFLSYGSRVEIPLSGNGVVYINGPLGSGKSTIIEAIVYLLCGKLLRDFGVIKNLVNQSSDGFELSLLLNAHGKEVEIKEIRNRGAESGLFLTVDGDNQVGSNVADTRAKLWSLMGITADDLLALSIWGQDQFRSIINGTPGARSKEIVRIFGLDRYDLSLKECDVDVQNCVKKLKKYDEKLVMLRDHLQTIETSLTDKSGDIEDTEKLGKLSSLSSKLLRKIKEAEKNLMELRDRNLQLTDELARGETLEANNSKATKMRNNLKELEKQLEQLEEVEGDTHSIEEEVRVLQKRAAVCAGRLEVWQKDFGELSKADKNACWVDHETPCPINLPAKYIKEQCQQHQENIDKCQLEYDKTNKAIKKAKSKADLLKQRVDLTGDLKYKRQALAALNMGGEIDTASLSVAKNECVRSIDEVDELLGSLRHRNSKITVDIAELEEKIKQHEKVRQVMDGVLVQIKDVESEKSVLDDEYLYLAAAYQMLKKAKMYKIDFILEQLNIKLQEALDTITGGAFRAHLVSQKQDARGKRLLDELDIMVSDGHKEVPVGMLSGGEKAQVGIAAMLAAIELAQNLTQKFISSLWLDEIFGPISPDDIDRVFEAVVSVIERVGLESTYVISHRDLDLNMFNHVWYTSKQNGSTVLRFE